MILVSGASLIGRVRVRYTTPDPLSAELRAGSLVRTISFDVPALPPAAILCVRRVADPLPGRVRLERWQSAAPRQWSGAVTDALGSAWRAAARPALGQVPNDAEAVWFADRADLLAALAMDWAAGAVGRHWWWRNLVSPSDAAGVFAEWESAPEFVPAAVEVLAAGNRAVDFARRLPTEIAGRILHRVLAAHAISLPAPGIHAPSAPESPPPSTQPGVLAHQPRPPWRDLAGAATTTLMPAQEALLGVALMLRREPARVRSAAFANAFREWQSSHRSTEERAIPGSSQVADIAEPPQPDTSMPEARESIGAGPLEPRGQGGPGPDTESSAGRIRPMPQSPAPEHAMTAPNSPRTDERIAPVPPREQAAEQTIPVAETELETVTGSATGRVESQPGNPAAGVCAALLPPTEMRSTPTEFGGLLFVLNAVLALGFYADFATPGGPNLDINPWDLLALAGEQWCGEAFRADPICGLLAELAGREADQEPASGLPSATESIETLTEWIAHALVMERDAAPGFLIPIRAKIATTLTHIDAFFSLQQHPIEIRCSGLDRDPGWIPAAGRYVAFHFD